MRRVSPVSRILHEDPSYADSDIEAMYDHMEKLEHSLQAAYETLREIETYGQLPHVDSPGGQDSTPREKYLRRILSEIKSRASQTLRMMDEIVSPEIGQ